MKYARIFLIIFLIVTGVSCGIEDYPYIFPVPVGNIHNEFTSRVTINLPNYGSGDNSYFTNYIIFYRIYISDYDTQSGSETEFPRISSSLNSDYQRVKPYIANDSMVSNNIASLFRSLNYYMLSIESRDIDNFLSNSSFGKELAIDFSNDSIPFMTINSGVKYNLLRYKGGENTPLPANRYFLNASDLTDENNIADTVINSDVTDKPGSERKYTYVSMFIVASGLNPQTFNQIFSSPALVGVLKLPDNF
ncbi:MAG: hypothetical protein FWD78_07520 [Treponema sp.]|nr:hypothetical protein [Treponema sp.]